MKFKPYPKYKDSGVDWLGEIPSHWDVKRLKNAFILQRGYDLPTETFVEGEYPVYGSNGIIGYHNHYTTKGPGLVIGRSGSVGEINYVTRNYWAHNTALFIRDFICMTPKYALYFLMTLDIKSLSEGTAVGTLNRNNIHNLRTAYPDIQEQETITSFLDHETVRIDSLIDKKQRLIELLKERRTALIHQAILHPGTKNLRLKHVADHVSRPIDRKNEEVYTAVGLYNWARGIFHKEPKGGVDLGDSDFFWLKSDDMILSGQFAWEGAVALASEEEEGCVVSHRYPVLRGKLDLMDTAYLWAFFTTKRGHFFLDDHSRGAAGRNRPLNIHTLCKEVIPVPSFIEQLKVAEHVYFERRFKKVIARSIELLQEYRAALISAVVTGKVDVRSDAF
jgi:type I restriction enzyme S subunit